MVGSEIENRPTTHKNNGNEQQQVDVGTQQFSSTNDSESPSSTIRREDYSSPIDYLKAMKKAKESGPQNDDYGKAVANMGYNSPSVSQSIIKKVESILLDYEKDDEIKHNFSNMMLNSSIGLYNGFDVGTSHYNPSFNKVKLESSSEPRCVFHEFGHALDAFLFGKIASDHNVNLSERVSSQKYISEYNGRTLYDTLMEEQHDFFGKASNVDDFIAKHPEIFNPQNPYSIVENPVFSVFSDMYSFNHKRLYTQKLPFKDESGIEIGFTGVKSGHHRGYWINHPNFVANEFFAEITTVKSMKADYDAVKSIFPKTCMIYDEIIKKGEELK